MTQQPPPPGLSARDLALELGDATGSQTLEESLQQIRDLRNADHPMPPPPPLAPARLFRASDVPKFTDNSKYEDFRSSLSMFLQSCDEPEPADYPRGLMRIIATFEDPVARAASQGWDVTPCIRQNWILTKKAFLAALDSKFASATVLEDAIVEFMRVHPKESESASSFFNRFEAAVARRRAIETRKNVTKVSDETVAARLLAILPRHLVDDLRLSYARRGEIIEMKTPEDLRPEFERTWAYVPAPYKPPKASTPAARQRAAPALPSAGNQVTQRRCGLVVSYDSAPAVPTDLRGGLYPSPRNNPQQNSQNAARRAIAASRHVCEYCRRPRSEHHASGPNFKAVTATDPPRTRAAPFAPITGPRVEDITEQRALPAPENPAA